MKRKGKENLVSRIPVQDISSPFPVIQHNCLNTKSDFRERLSSWEFVKMEKSLKTFNQLGENDLSRFHFLLLGVRK